MPYSINSTLTVVPHCNSAFGSVRRRFITPCCICVNVILIRYVGCVTRKQDRCPNSGMMPYNGWARFLTRREQEQAQTLPIGYCDHLSYNKTCDVIGDGWTVDVIKHILSFIPKGAV